MSKDSIKFIILSNDNGRALELTRQQFNAATIRLLLHSHQQNGTNFERKKLESIHITPERFVIHSLYPLRIQHRVLTRRQAHVLSKRALELTNGDGFSSSGDESSFGGGIGGNAERGFRGIVWRGGEVGEYDDVWTIRVSEWGFRVSELKLNGIRAQ